MSELRRDLQAVIGNKANINIAPTVETYGGETFLSQEVAINILQESKLAFKRCRVVSSAKLKLKIETEIMADLILFT